MVNVSKSSGLEQINTLCLVNLINVKFSNSVQYFTVLSEVICISSVKTLLHAIVTSGMVSRTLKNFGEFYAIVPMTISFTVWNTSTTLIFAYSCLGRPLKNTLLSSVIGNFQTSFRIRKKFISVNFPHFHTNQLEIT